MVKIAIMNLYLHRLEKARIELFNPLTQSLGGSYPGLKYDVILANPPFAGNVQKESILSDLNHGLDTRATELLFVKWFVDHLADGGRAGIIVPEGVVMGTDRASTALRRLLLEENSLEAVISLPHSSFKPYASVATFILVFRRSSAADRTWMYRLQHDGLSQDSVRLPVPENDIPDLLQRWAERDTDGYVPVDGKHGWAPAERIAERGFELAPRRYLLQTRIKHRYPTLPLKDLCTLTKGTTPAAKAEPGPYPLVTTAEELRTSPVYQFEGDAICIPLVSSTGHGHASIRQLTYMTGRFAAASIVAVLQVKDTALLLPRFLYYFLDSHKDELLVSQMKGAANVSLSLAKIGSVRVPVPPADDQKRMITRLQELDDGIASLKATLTGATDEKVQALREFAAGFSQ